MDSPTWREALEADARRLMAKIAANPARGYDSLKVRDGWIAELDRMLDAYADDINPNGMQAAVCGCKKLRIVRVSVLWCEWCDVPGGQ